VPVAVAPPAVVEPSPVAAALAVDEPSPTPAAPAVVESSPAAATPPAIESSPAGAPTQAFAKRALASPSSDRTQPATLAPRLGKGGARGETVKRESVRPAIVIDEEQSSAPKPGRLPRDLEALVAEAAAIPLPEGLLEDDAPRSKAASSAPPSELPVVGVFGDYEVYGRLAFGGMAEIFLARQMSSSGSQRNVVIKRILPHVAEEDLFVQMFLDEARLAIQLSHPNICHIYEFGRQDNSYFMAMEWVNGVPLGKLISRTRQAGGIPIAITVKIISHIAEALHYAHRARDERGRPLGIVHRDVSPANIMVSYEAGVKLLDFGVAKAASQGTKTVAGTVKGKFAYMSPQHCMGQEIDARADIFSLGVCLYEALTGKKLYHRPNEYETMQAIVDGPVPSARDARPDLPDVLDTIVKKALAKKPEDRYQSAGEMQSALEHYLQDSREVVGASRVQEYLDELYHTEIRRGPQVDASISTGLSRVRVRPLEGADGGQAGAATNKDFEVTLDVPGASSQPPPKKTLPIAAIAGAVAVLALVGGGAWAFGVTGRSPAQPAAPRTHAPEVPTRPIVEARNAADTPPPPVVPVAAATGALAVQSVPSGGQVEVDGVAVPGTTPIALPAVAAGAHAVRVTRAGFDPWTGEVVIAAGAVATLDAALVARRRAPTAPPATLSINTRPWSKVYVGSTLIGTTPIGRATIPSGTIRLRIVDRDGVTHMHPLDVAPGGSAHVSLDFTGSN
jgi:serine/threonine-protein kinase